MFKEFEGIRSSLSIACIEDSATVPFSKLLHIVSAQLAYSLAYGAWNIAMCPT